MWWFKKKQEPKKPKKLYVPKEKIIELYELLGRYNNNSQLDKYRFWVAAHRIFPEMEKGDWSFETHRITQPYFLWRSDNY